MTYPFDTYVPIRAVANTAAGPAMRIKPRKDGAWVGFLNSAAQRHLGLERGGVVQFLHDPANPGAIAIRAAGVNDQDGLAVVGGDGGQVSLKKLLRSIGVVLDREEIVTLTPEGEWLMGTLRAMPGVPAAGPSVRRSARSSTRTQVAPAGSRS